MSGFLLLINLQNRTMKVFISWSGERSRQVAELFKIWLKCVIQACDPWVSTEDIESGSFWFNEISNQLAETSVGIVCLTQENKDKPWILFETGALTKGLTSNRVIPFLIDLQPQDIYPPLSQLNAVLPTDKGLFMIARTINLQLKDNQLATDVLKPVFDTYWPQFDLKFKDIIENTPDQDKTEIRKDKDILSEILLTVRGFEKRIRSLEEPNSTSSVLYSRNIASSSLSLLQVKEQIRRSINTSLLLTGKLPTVKEISNDLENLQIDSFKYRQNIIRILSQHKIDSEGNKD